MSSLAQEVRAAFLEVDDIDIEALCPGITETKTFIAYCEHLAASDNLEIMSETLVHAIAIIADGELSAGRLKEHTSRYLQNDKKHEAARDLLRKAAALQGLAQDFYTERTPEPDLDVARAFSSDFVALVGNRGKASDNVAATKALYVRLLDKAVPVSFPHRYSFIADIMKRLGIDYTRQGVRSLLLKGRT